VATAAAARHERRSGFALLTSGPEAFAARSDLAALAERTLDVQYYVWEDDASGRLLTAALLRAADRGVRVRVLLDDTHTVGRDSDLALLDSHPNIQVRLFNPLAERDWRLMDALREFPRINHRMHNKAFIADNAAAIAGGRNVGDAYFTADPAANFRDLDALAVGPVVRELSRSFDDFWNSGWSVPIRALVRERAEPARLGRLAARLEANTGSAGALPFERGADRTSPDELLRRLRDGLVWGEATVVADRPDKPATERPVLLEGLRALLRESGSREVLIESAYLIPSEGEIGRLCRLVAGGSRVRVLTNSLASTDVVLAYVAYAKRRARLLRCGVELYELRADARLVRRWRWLSGRSTAALHTKAIVVDRRQVVVGSFNLDPRSAKLNTELAVVVDSPALAADVAAFVEDGMAPENAWRLGLDRDGHTVWLGDEGDRPVRLTRAPMAGFWRALGLDLLWPLPIDGQL
jgi:putative cardiolipin synthase